MNRKAKKLQLIICAVLMLLCAVLCFGFAFADSGVQSASGKTTEKSDSVVHVKTGGKGDGKSEKSPLGSFSDAVAALADTGGVVVVCGELDLKGAVTVSECRAPITVTSDYNGVDYRTKGAALILQGDVTQRCEVRYEFLNIKFSSAVSFYANYNSIGIGAEVETSRIDASGTYRYPIIFGGYKVGADTADAVSNDRDSCVSIDSGTWDTVICGNYRPSVTSAMGINRGRSALIINGGTFNRTSDLTFPVSATGMNYFSGDVYMEINGGVFENAVYAVMRSGQTVSSTSVACAKCASGDVLVRITGGNFSQVVGVTCAYDLSPGNNAYNINDSLDGDATFVISGGSYKKAFITYCACGDLLLKYDPTRLESDFLSLCDGFPIRLRIDSDTALDTKNEYVSATISEQIDNKAHGNDPYVISDPNDDCYYYVYSSGGVKITKAGNIGLFKQGTTAENSAGVNNYTKIYNGVKIVDASKYSGSQPCKQYWAPEIHYIPREIAGDNYGWYCYVAASDSSDTDAAHRMYVYKCPDPEDPMTPDWPLVGKITDSSNYWAIDGTVIIWGGEMYFAWSGRESSGLQANAQNICIAKMSNPWTLSEERRILSSPSLSWERYQTSPAVNEGPQAFEYDGKLYLTYSANGSWAKNYCFGLLEYKGTGSLSDPSNWIKRTSGPFFSRNNSVSSSPYGTGHGSVIRALDGTLWVVFHANPTLTTSSSANWWSRRMVYAQPLDMSQSGGQLVANYAKAVTAENSIAAHNGEYCNDHFYVLDSRSGSTLTDVCLICHATRTVSACDRYGHGLGEWHLTLSPTQSSEGEERRECVDCSYYVSRSIDVLPEDTTTAVTETETSTVDDSDTVVVTDIISEPERETAQITSGTDSTDGEDSTVLTAQRIQQLRIHPRKTRTILFCLLLWE